MLCRQKQGVLTFGLNTAPHVFTCLGHTVAAYLHCQGILVIPYLEDWLIHHPDCQVLLLQQSQLLDTLELVGLKLSKVKSELDPVQDIQFLGLQLRPGSVERFPPNIQGSGDNITCVPDILPNSFVVQSSVPVHWISWASGLISLGRLYMRPLQQHFHSLGLTNWFKSPCRSDPLILATYSGNGRT